MFRAIAVLGIGVLIGISAAYALVQHNAAPAGVGFTAERNLIRSPSDTAAERLRLEHVVELLEPAIAAELSGPETLEREIRRLAAGPRDPRQDALLDALLGRLLDQDPELAHRVAREAGLGLRQLIPLFRRWTELDADAALSALGELDPPGARRAIALELFDVVGNDADGVEMLAGIWPDIDQTSFRTEAIVRRMRTDPDGALQAALAIEDATAERHTLMRLAFEWGDYDPRAAMNALERIPDRSLRLQYHNYVLTRWARLDPAAALQYLTTADEQYVVNSNFSIQTVTNMIPAQVFAASDRFPPDLQAQVRSFAITVLAEQDPVAAIAVTAALPPGQEREALLRPIAAQYSRQDPAAAVAWALSQPNARSLLPSVVSAVASIDFDRAVGLAFQHSSDPYLMQLVALRAGEHPDSIPALANRLVAAGAVHAEGLTTLLGEWASERPASALDWALDNNAALTSELTSVIARGFASSEGIGSGAIESAMQASARIPPDYRDDWLVGVASAYAGRDAATASEWIAGFRGQPGYGRALTVVVSSLAPRDPLLAARLFDRSTGDIDASAGAVIADAWASQDPAAAARWSASVAVPEARRTAIGRSVARWARADVSAASNWVLEMNGGSDRDEALSALIATEPGTISGSAGDSLLEAYSSGAARESTIARIIDQIAIRDRSLADRLVDEYVSDPAQRAVAEERLARIQQ
jgi:hypothetical protein